MYSKRLLRSSYPTVSVATFALMAHWNMCSSMLTTVLGGRIWVPSVNTHGIPDFRDCSDVSCFHCFMFSHSRSNLQFNRIANCVNSLRAILSWNVLPTPGDPYFCPVFGNTLDQYILFQLLHMHWLSIQMSRPYQRNKFWKSVQILGSLLDTLQITETNWRQHVTNHYQKRVSAISQMWTVQTYMVRGAHQTR